jgi:hypothetical protein
MSGSVPDRAELDRLTAQLREAFAAYESAIHADASDEELLRLENVLDAASERVRAARRILGLTDSISL